MTFFCICIFNRFCNYLHISTFIPPTLITVIASVALSIVLNKTFGTGTIKTIGDLYEIPSDLPHLVLPDFRANINIFSIIKNGFFLTALESLLSAVVADKMGDDKHYPNTELIAQGLGNICSCLFGGIPATSAIARTASNIKAGATSPISGIFASVVIFFVLMLFAPYAAFIPMPCIAAILVSVAYNMSGWRNIRDLVKKSKNTNELIANRILLAVVFVITLLFNLIIAIALGCVIYAVFLKMGLVAKSCSFKN